MIRNERIFTDSVSKPQPGTNEHFRNQLAAEPKAFAGRKLIRLAGSRINGPKIEIRYSCQCPAGNIARQTEGAMAMSTRNIRISAPTHQVLKLLADQTGQRMGKVVEKALDAYHRKLFFEQMNAGYAELRADAEAWAEHLAEPPITCSNAVENT